MKPILLALVTLALTLNTLGLELVKCGSIKLDAASAAIKQHGTVKLLRAKPDGTSLFYFQRNAVVIVIPFVKTFSITPRKDTQFEPETNFISDTLIDGVREIKYAVRRKTKVEFNDIHTAFATANGYGYLNYRRIIESDGSWSEYTIRGEAVSHRELEGAKSTNTFLLEKFHYDSGVIESIEIPSGEYVNSLFNADNEGGMYFPEFKSQRRFLIPKLEDGVLNFYIVEDPDLFPDTALGAPRVEGGSATFNVTTGSEEPVEIQASDDLKIWKRLKTLEDANGRSVTVPADAAQGFLRAVER